MKTNCRDCGDKMEIVGNSCHPIRICYCPKCSNLCVDDYNNVCIDNYNNVSATGRKWYKLAKKKKENPVKTLGDIKHLYGTHFRFKSDIEHNISAKYMILDLENIVLSDYCAFVEVTKGLVCKIGCDDGLLRDEVVIDKPYFPILINLNNINKLMVIKSPNEIPIGVSFIVVETNYKQR